MKVLTYESLDKKTRTIKNISPEVLEIELQEDNGLVEVIPMRDPKNLVRIYFDLDIYDITIDPIQDILQAICYHFNCLKEDWSIGSSHRINKLSYHIVSRKFCISIQLLRDITHMFSKLFPAFDTRHLYFGIQDELECGYYRLPNQSKHVLNKVGPPIKIEYGNMREFFITYTDGLIVWKNTS
jgi:hypothetical protein